MPGFIAACRENNLIIHVTNCQQYTKVVIVRAIEYESLSAKEIGVTDYDETLRTVLSIPRLRDLDWYDLGRYTRVSADDAHEGDTPSLEIAWDFFTENPECCGHDQWPSDMPTCAPVEWVRGYESLSRMVHMHRDTARQNVIDSVNEAARKSHGRNYEKLHVLRDGTVSWFESINRTDDIIDPEAGGFQAIQSVGTYGTGSFGCNCDHCQDAGYASKEEAVDDAVWCDQSDIETAMLAALDAIPAGYFADEVTVR